MQADLRSRTGLACAALAVLAAWLLASPAAAAPITVTYEITGGETFGGFLPGNPLIQSGTVVITMPNRGSGLPPIHTPSPVFDFQLTATNGEMRHLRAGYGDNGSASYGPAQADYFYYQFDTICSPHNADCSWRASLSVSAGGNIVRGRWSSRFSDFLSPPPTSHGVRNLVGREVSATEPASGSLGVAGLLGLAGGAAGARIARRLRTRATPR